MTYKNKMTKKPTRTPDLIIGVFQIPRLSTGHHKSVLFLTLKIYYLQIVPQEQGWNSLPGSTRFGQYLSFCQGCNVHNKNLQSGIKFKSTGMSLHTNLRGGNTGSGAKWCDLSVVNRKWAESCITRCMSFSDWSILR